MKHKRAVVLALRLLGVIFMIFNGFDLIRCILGIITDGNVIAYISQVIIDVLWILGGVIMLIAAGIIKKKYIR